MHETPTGRAMMAGAEGESGLDLDRHVIRLDPRAIVAPMNKKAPCPHGFKAGQRIGDPVALLRHAESRREGGGFVCGGGDQRPDRLLVRLRAKIGFHEPRFPPARPWILGLERGRRGLGRLEALKDQVGDGAGAALVADEAHHVGGVIGRQAFEHADPDTPNTLRPRAADRHRGCWLAGVLRRVGPAAKKRLARNGCNPHANPLARAPQINALKRQ